MGDDYEIERKIIETLIGPVIRHDAKSWCTVWRFKERGHVTIGRWYKPNWGLSGDGWCYVPETHPIMWPPCSFVDFLQRLSDPETRKKHGLPPL